MEQQVENTAASTAAPNPPPAAQAPAQGSTPTFLGFVEKYKKIISYVLGGIVVLIIGLTAYNYLVLAPMELEAQDKIASAQMLFERDSMNMALNGAPSTAPGQEPALGLMAISDEYGATETGKLAAYYAGVALMHQGQYEQAIDKLEGFKTNSRIFKPLSLGLLGDAYSQLRNYDKAADNYMKAAKADDNEFTAPRFYKKAGLAFEETGKPAKALDAYQTIKDKYSTSQEASTIDKYIYRAKAKAGK